jgi:hypothetical protein
MAELAQSVFPLEDGTVYSKRKDFLPFSAPPLEAYASIVGPGKMENYAEYPSDSKV